MRKICFVFIFLFLVGCGNAGISPTRPNPNTNNTGIQPDPTFLPFFNQNGGTTIFGSPISGKFEFEGQQVQYFQRMRLEIDENGSVQISPLGRYFWQQRNVVAGTLVQDEFLAFYEANGGEAMFGAVLSPQVAEGERWVQYFENGIFEWHPENPADSLVVLGELGQAHYLESGAKYVYTDFVSLRASAVNSGSQYNVSVAVSHPILFQEDTQNILVTVTTPEGNPVSNRPVEIRMRYENGQATKLPTQQTDESGMLKVQIPPTTDVPSGQTVVVEVNLPASNGGSLGGNGITYQVWW